MSLVLVDSSVWIDFFNGNAGKEVDHLSRLIGSGESIATCPPVVQEVLQGFKSDADFNLVAYHLREARQLAFSAYEGAEAAAQIFRSLRKKGITIRKGSDCLIAWYALQGKCAVLHRDRDFDLMVKPLSLKILR
jgi:predicted nucleic acid-binding protein